MNRVATFLAVMGFVSGCATRDAVVALDLEPGRLSTPDTVVSIQGLGPCTDSSDRSLRFDSRQPVNVLVHGCFGSSGQFRALAQVLAFHGQQSACFTYDDRAKLSDSAAELRSAIKQLAEQSHVPQITLIGHSQGALIARKSLTESLHAPLPLPPIDLRLVTVSGPFAGIESARTCGKGWLYPLTLGLLPLSCYVATGPKWADITYSSRFILEPGELDGATCRPGQRGCGARQELPVTGGRPSAGSAENAGALQGDHFGLEAESFSIMPAHHAKKRPFVVANARHSPGYGCALRLDRPPFGMLLGHARNTPSL